LCLLFGFREREREWYGMDVGKNENGGAFINNGGKKRKEKEGARYIFPKNVSQR
jgi:hypothetical protein